MNKLIPDNYKKTEAYINASASERTAMNKQYRTQQQLANQAEEKKRLEAEVVEFDKSKDEVFDGIINRLGVLRLKINGYSEHGYMVELDDLTRYNQSFIVDYSGGDIQITLKEEYRAPLIFSKSKWKLDDSKKALRFLDDIECSVDCEMLSVEKQVEEIKRLERERIERNAMREELMSSLDPKYHGLISSKE